MRTFNRLNVNWYFVGACIAIAILWRVIYRAVQIIFFHF